MAYPISKRARAFVRKRATDVMEYTCRIERVHPPTVDTSSLHATAETREIIYQGQCRLWDLSGSGPLIIGDVDMALQTTHISIPWDVPQVPRRKDEILILTSHTDHAVVNKRFQIQSSAKAGELRATRRFEVSAMEKVH